MNLYERTEEHQKNNECFRLFVRSFSLARFFQPSPEKSPWHWQTIVRGEGPYDVLINFWPHVAKAQKDGEKSVEGWDQIRLLMLQVIDENGFGDGSEVIE